MTLHEKLQRLTALHNLRAVADAAGVSKEALRMAVNGDVRPRRATLVVVARVLNVDASWLANDEESWPPVWCHHEGRVVAVA